MNRGAGWRRALGYVGVLPVSAAAAALAAPLLLTGTRARLEAGVLEVSGGLLRPILRRAVPGFPISAITLGHVVYAADARCLVETRAHERVHVAQYERWGFLFPFLYVAASARALLAGGHVYRDNAFEREAVRRAEETAAA
ncbi:MAG TPA: hypothetical protein VN032_12155 [Thermoanaerobaculia bacterium]|nr:hypothetical protein [Thermoanaerobaculia bacterium]